ncbi:hypothetical protein BO94DRAFT_507372 [Aspergillus sclerotioniger CBS 115572]|uniref:FHA domain-containing protein n=1 Tax=Aspergillus sclerotioniger CBS 115572 TaxID=1450535 RepID=A0A317XBI7_9EURO|nr:hypothetical protein BO94DRAFT_507372 [Aspergillus sclerotioniger CBS 115572]PWY95936.1 hypothetical protein BO94DRAFT_507372 [Aspergillus sclerotioniger CBS 115572]
MASRLISRSILRTGRSLHAPLPAFRHASHPLTRTRTRIPSDATVHHISPSRMYQSTRWDDDSDPTGYSATTPKGRIGRYPSNVDAMALEGKGITRVHWGNQYLSIVDRLIPPQTIIQFIECLMHGTLPNGKETERERLEQEEFGLLSVPVAQWAGTSSPGGEESILHRIMVVVGSHEDPRRLCTVGKNIHSVKTRLWEGMVPMSAARWQDKGLSEREYFDTACEYLTAVITAFEYLNNHQVRANLRDGFNLISDHLGMFEEALNVKRRERGQKLLDLRGLWEEFIRAKYEVMTSRAHGWVVDRVKELQEKVIGEICALPVMNEEEISQEMEKWTTKLFHVMEITSLADMTIWMPMEGYAGYQPSEDVVAGLRNPNLGDYRKNYSDKLQAIVWPRMEQLIQEQLSKQPDDSNGQSPESRAKRFAVNTIAQDDLRQEIRGPAPVLVPEAWIQRILHFHELSQSVEEEVRMSEGLAIYRLAYQVSDAEWEACKGKLEAHLASWGAGVDKAEEVKPLLKIHWFDGKELGFGDHDIDAAKKHYLEIRDSDAYVQKLQHDVFLVADGWSIASYKESGFHSPTKAMLPGDFQGHILAVDASFDPAAPNEHAEESPGFDGQMRILGNLVWSDLYAMLALRCGGLEDMWPLAMDHPQKAYTGLTVPLQRKEWAEENAITAAVMKPFLEHLKEKHPEMAPTVEKLMMPHQR